MIDINWMASFPGMTTRETSLVCWALLIVGFALFSPSIRPSFLNVFSVLFGSNILRNVLLTAAVYVCIIVCALWYCGYWRISFADVTIAWFLGSALAATFSYGHVEPSYFRRLLTRNVAVAAVIEFAMTLYTFPLPVELLLVPLTTLIVCCQVVAESKPEYKPTKRVLEVSSAIIGLAIVGFSLREITVNFHEMLTWNNLREFFLPFVLTAGFVPYLYALRLFAVFQSMFTMLKFHMRDNPPMFKFARRLVFRKCGVDLQRAQFFAENFARCLSGESSRENIVSTLAEFSQAYASRKSTSH